MAKIKKKKKVCNSVTTTTGNIGLNIDHFNYTSGTGALPTGPYSIGNASHFGTADISTFAAGAEASGNGDGAASSGDGGGMGESLENANLDESTLTEKRETKRYYIRPQGIFCANKADVLKGLIEVGHENCSVYTLKNLTDHDNVQELSNKDIIYYYDNEILYDKNHVKVMDYDLFIKHEEERDKVSDNGEDLSQAEWNDNYDDRMTQNTELEEGTVTTENPFDQTFESYNVYGRRLIEGKEETEDCAICGEPIEGDEYDAEPCKKGCCCEACYLKFVEPKKMGITDNN